jgi:hypothetical protein
MVDRTHFDHPSITAPTHGSSQWTIGLLGLYRLFRRDLLMKPGRPRVGMRRFGSQGLSGRVLISSSGCRLGVWRGVRDRIVVVKDRPVSARLASDAEKFLRWCRRNPVPAGLLAALVLVFWVAFGLSPRFLVGTLSSNTPRRRM